MKNERFEYPQINQKKTGEWLRALCKHYQYSVKDIQEYLHISSNQAIYEWFNGHTLPSVNNLLALSLLFNLPMNALLVDDIHEMISYKPEADVLYKRRLDKYVFLMSPYIIRMEKNGA